MSLIDAFPMRQISSVPDPASLYAELISIIMCLAQYGLIHGDFNEFNILIREDASSKSGDPKADSIILTPILIDFPQMVSIDHANAEYYFNRDVNCIKRFFERRFHFVSDEKGPYFADARKLIGKDGIKRLDVFVEASGFSRKMAKELEAYMKEVGVDGDGDGDGDGSLDALRGGESFEDDDEDEDEDEEGNGGGGDREAASSVNDMHEHQDIIDHSDKAKSAEKINEAEFLHDLSHYGETKMSQLTIIDKT